MKKQINVKGYSYTRNGKRVTVKGYKREIDAAEMAADAIKKAKGAGSELTNKKSKRSAWDEAYDEWDKLIDSMSDKELYGALAEDGYLDADLEPKEQRKFKHLKKVFGHWYDPKKNPINEGVRQDLKGWFRGQNEWIRKEYGDSEENLDWAKDCISQWSGKTDAQMKKLKSLGLNVSKDHGSIWETKNGSYRLYTQQGVNAFLSKFGHLTPKEINMLPDSKLVSRKKKHEFDEKGTQKVLDLAAKRIKQEDKKRFDDFQALGKAISEQEKYRKMTVLERAAYNKKKAGYGKLTKSEIEYYSKK